VAALTDANGTCVQTYEYSVYGHVAASDPNHPNPFMFTGRQFDIETGLYYYRARYYSPDLGRFLQTDPVGYGDGINWYLYCGNNPLNLLDPSGSEGVRVPFGVAVRLLPWIRRPWLPPLLVEILLSTRPWTHAHFWLYYRFGSGEPVYLDDIGLLERFKADPYVVAPEVARFESVAMEFAANRIAWIRELNSLRGKYGQPPIESDFVDLRNRKLYDFYKVEYFFDLYPLGNGWLNLNAWGYVYADGRYEITFQYYAFDWFRDPYDLLHKVPDDWITFEVKDCTPYPIIARWTITRSGDVDG